LERGLARLKNGQLRVISRENGLFDNIINAIVPDDRGSLWVDSGRGYFSVTRDSLNAFADGKTNRVQCTGYDGPDAVKSSDKNQQQASGCKTPDGRIWFPTAQGVVMINPTNLTLNPVPPPVHVQSVRANGHEVKALGKAVMPPGKGELEFHYAGLSFIAPEKIHYRYQLEGYDKTWVEADTRRSAFYTNLKPGKYHFQVQASNSDGIWNTAGAGFEVELLPFFYQTTWFFVLAGGLVTLGLFGLYAWRMRRLNRRQKELQTARDLLETRVQERTAELKNEIEERKRAELEIERIHRQLVDASRQAGQAEVASSVLHNVGNVLNSVNVSTTLIADRLRNSRIANLTKSIQLMREHESDLGTFITGDDRGRKLLPYLENLADHFRQEQAENLAELKGLADNVEHIKEIVAMQQNYAHVSGTIELVDIAELLDAALKIHSGAYLRHSVKVVRQYEMAPAIAVDRHKVLQIFINILQNARQACQEGRVGTKQVTVRIQPNGNDRVHIEIEDNGVGIAPENLTRIFSHGFTTRKQGHGFGLHSAALAAREMGGSLTVRSEGLGQGATFILELPTGRVDNTSPETSSKAGALAQPPA
jgi:signal transduction histidine kinase